MAVFLRRAVSSRITAIPMCFLHSRRIHESLVSPMFTKCYCPELLKLPTFDLFIESRRGYAKWEHPISDFEEEIRDSMVSRMKEALLSFSLKLSKITSGRASSEMFDHIVVTAREEMMPLKQLAVISVLDPYTLAITLVDQYRAKGFLLKAIEKAISASSLGVVPKDVGYRVVVFVPPLKEDVQANRKMISKAFKGVNQRIESASNKAINRVKRSSPFSPKGYRMKFEMGMLDITKKFLQSAEDMFKKKEEELRQG